MPTLLMPRLVAAICLIAATTTGCDGQADSGPLLPGVTTTPAGIRTGLSLPAPTGRKFSVTGFDMCTKTDPVMITSVTFSASNARLVDSKMYLRGPGAGSTTGQPSLATGGSAATGTIVNHRCQLQGPPEAQELDVLLIRTDQAPATGEITIGYRSKHKNYALTYPVTITLK